MQNYYPLNQIKPNVADDCLYLIENNASHKRFFMINSSWFTSFVTCTRVSLVVSKVLVLTRVTLSWYADAQGFTRLKIWRSKELTTYGQKLTCRPNHGHENSYHEAYQYTTIK